MRVIQVEIQKELAAAGVYTGKIDGVFGWQSYSAVAKLIENSKKNIKLREFIKKIQQHLADAKLYFNSIDGDFGPGSYSALNHMLPAPKITDEHLKKIYKNAAPGFAQHISQFIENYHIKTKADLCAFIANTLHESNGYKVLRENVNYTAKNLITVFPKYFKTLAEAQKIQSRGVVAICDVIYGGRMGNNRNGDGYKFRGAGILQITGRENYELCSIGIGMNRQLLDNPELLTQPVNAIKSALWFWQKNNCSRHVNQGNFTQACRIVNGGTKGLQERTELYEKAWSVIF